jgi:hypothetical protein
MKLNNGNDLDTLSSEINAAIAAVMTKHGLSGKVGRAAYMRDGSSVEFKLHVATIVKNADGEAEAQSRELLALKTYAKLNGITDEMIKKPFTSNGVEFILTGYNTRAKSAPYQATRVSDGARFKFPRAMIQRAYGVPVTAY